MTKRIITAVILTLLIVTGIFLLLLLFNFTGREVVDSFGIDGIDNVDNIEEDSKVKNYGLVLEDSSLIEDFKNSFDSFDDYLKTLDDSVKYEHEEYYESMDPEAGGGGDHETTNECVVDSDCEDDYEAGVCYLGNVYKKSYEFSCQQNNCDTDTTKELVELCELGCNDGECIITQCSDDTDNDNDGLTDEEDPGCWDDISDKDSYNKYLDDESRATVQCFTNAECGSDGFVADNFCVNDDVYNIFIDVSCNNPGTGISACSFPEEIKLIEDCSSEQFCSDGICENPVCNEDSDCDDNNNYTEDSCVNTGKDASCEYEDIVCLQDNDCGTDGFIDGKMCQNNDIYQTYRAWDCVNQGTTQSQCVYDDDEKKISDCDDICVNGECLPITCNEDSDCGVNDYVGKKFCDINSGDIYQDYKIYMCVSPGTLGSSCNSYVDEKLITDCQYDCNPYTNSCITEICNDNKDNDGDGLIDGLTELNPDNGLTYVYPTNNPLWGYVNNPFELAYEVDRINENYNMGYTNQIYYSGSAGNVIMRSWYTSPVPPYGGDYYYDTLDEVCYILGYNTVTGHTCESQFGDGCGFSSPHDNFMWRFDGSDFTKVNAPYYKTWISRIECKDKLPACMDGRDNDYDGKIDSKDDGCASSTDDSEIAHDSECEI